MADSDKERIVKRLQEEREAYYSYEEAYFALTCAIDIVREELSD